jgi:hypothetical protein
MSGLGNTIHAFPGPVVSPPAGIVAGQSHQWVTLNGKNTLGTICASGIIPRGSAVPNVYPTSVWLGLNNADSATETRVTYDGLSVADVTAHIGVPIPTEQAGGIRIPFAAGLAADTILLDSAGSVSVNIAFGWGE